MDLPVHVAAGALVGEAILYTELKFRQRSSNIKLGTACFLLGVLSHLLLDALPYYDWLFYIHIFRPLPFYWLYPQIIVTIPVMIFVFSLSRDHWILAAIAMLGGTYPDIEKLLYFDFDLPEYLVLFRHHSLRLSASSWEHAHKSLLIAFEIFVFFVILAEIYRVSRRRKQLQDKKPVKEALFGVLAGSKQ